MVRDIGNGGKVDAIQTGGAGKKNQLEAEIGWWPGFEPRGFIPLFVFVFFFSAR